MTWRSKTEHAFSGNNGGAPYGDKPAGVVADDIILLALSMDGGAATITSWPSGFTEIMQASVGGPDGRTSAVAWKRAGGSEPSTYVITMSGTTGADTLVTCAAWSGRDTTNPPTWGTANNIGTGSASPVTANANGVTAVAGDDLAWFAFADTTGATPSFAPPSGYTERIDAIGTSSYSSTTLATLDNASAGATGTVAGTLTFASGTAGYDAILIRIPAAAGDTTAPVLTAPTGVATSSTAATVGATTDTAEGTMYGIASSSATVPTKTQIRSGQDHTGSAAAGAGNVAVSSTGAKTVNITGLTPGSSYYPHVVHVDVAGNESNIVSGSQWTQLVKKVKLKLDIAAAGETVNGIVWEDQAGAIAGAEIGEFTGQTIGTGSGADAGLAVLKVPVSVFGGGSLNVGDTVQVYVRKPDLSKDSDVFPATVIEE